MARVPKATIAKAKAALDAHSQEIVNKCALCSETLTHIVKSVEAQTGAPTATVTRMLADRISDNAAPGGRVTPRQLEGRVYRQENDIPTNRGNKSEPEPKHRTYAEVYQATERRMAAAAKYLWDEHPGTEAEKAEALRLILQSIESKIPKVEEPANLTPAKAARHEIARKILKPCAEKAITVAVGAGLDKALHLGDDFSMALSTSAGSGKLLVAEVTFKKIGGT